MNRIVAEFKSKTENTTKYEINDWIDVNPHFMGHEGWRVGQIFEIINAQIFIGYLHLVPNNKCTMWVHVDDITEVRPYLSMSEYYWNVGIKKFEENSELIYTYDKKFDLISFTRFIHKQSNNSLNNQYEKIKKLIDDERLIKII